MRIVFFGTGEYGIPTLKRLLESKHEVLAIVTQPDKKKGRGWNVFPTPIKASAEKAAPHVEVLQPLKVNDAEFREHLKAKDADLFIVIDYGQFLGKELLALPKKFCINLHPSLLPQYRGAAPVNWAIMNGESETGTTVFRMNERMDAGDIIVQYSTKMKKDETAPELLERLAQVGATVMMKALDLIGTGDFEFRKQEESLATKAPKLVKNDGRIEWAKPADVILRKIRAMQPWPGAFTLINGDMLKVWSAHEVPETKAVGTPGTVIDSEKFVIKAGEGIIEIDTLQLEGKRIMKKYEFLRGYDVPHGTVLG